MQHHAQGRAAQRRGRWWAAPGLAAALLAGCAPALDWRDVTLGEQTRLQFPCKPDRIERRLPLAGAEVSARMLQCDAGGASWSAVEFEMVEPLRVHEALRELRTSFAQRLGAPQAPAVAASVAGATPSPEARRLELQGRLDDGTPVQARAVFVGRGTRAFQVVVLVRGDTAPRWAESADEFLASVRWPI